MDKIIKKIKVIIVLFYYLSFDNIIILLKYYYVMNEINFGILIFNWCW